MSDGPAVSYRVQKGYQAMHPSLIEKPFLTVADLHLIMKRCWDMGMTSAELSRMDALGDTLDDYLTQSVGEDWEFKEALVG